jgi:drug/metabolite transporter (DMT)-like permease
LTRASLALLAVSLLWGTTFVAVKSGLRDASPLLFVSVRFALATLGSTPLLRSRRGFSSVLRPALPLGAVLALGYATQTLGLATTTPARSAFVTGMNVALVPVWGLLLLGRRPRALSLLGLAATVPGLWLLTDPGGGGWNAGDGWTTACAVFFALHVVLLNRLAPGRPVGALLVAQLAVTTVLCAAAALLLEEPHFRPRPSLAGALLLTAILATTGTTWLQLRFQPRVDPTRAALIYATEPVFAAFFSWLVFRELLTGLAWAGGGLILSGMVLAELGSGGAGDPAGSPAGGPR